MKEKFISLVNFVFLLYLYKTFTKWQTLQEKKDNDETNMEKEIKRNITELKENIKKMQARKNKAKETFSTDYEEIKKMNEYLEELSFYNNQEESDEYIHWKFIFVFSFMIILVLHYFEKFQIDNATIWKKVSFLIVLLAFNLLFVIYTIQLYNSPDKNKLYELMGTNQFADKKQINSDYRQQQKKYHPDKKGGKDSYSIQITNIRYLLLKKNREDVRDYDNRKDYDDTGLFDNSKVQICNSEIDEPQCLEKKIDGKRLSYYPRQSLFN